MDSSRLALTGAAATDQSWRTHNDPRIRIAEGHRRWRQISFPTPGPVDGAPVNVARQAVKTMNKGNFFRVDRRTWSAVCGLGMNPAVAYLVLAQGTDANNRLTRWSTTSLKTYAGMTWERGRLAIEQLVESEFIRYAKDHTRARPRYQLPTWQEVLSARPARADDYDRKIYDDIKVGKQPRTKLERGAAERLVRLGLVQESGRREYRDLSQPDLDPSGEYIWLPNTLVTGTVEGEESPVRRLRSAGDIWTLRLLVDLYHAQNLRDDGGISPRVLREKYERKLVGQQGIFYVWGFKQTNRELYWAGPFVAHQSRHMVEVKGHPIWENINQLCRCGLLTFVPHLWEADSAGAEVIHAYGIKGIGGEQLEIEIGEAAHQAGLRMALEAKVTRASLEGYSWFAPIKNTLPDAQLIGVARLRYRPHTQRTSEWFADLNENVPRWIQFYQALNQKAEQPGRLNGEKVSAVGA